MTYKNIVQYSCDACGNDLSAKTPIVSYFLELSSVQSRSDIIGSRSPEYEGNKHFCNSGCLRNWINRKSN